MSRKKIPGKQALAAALKELDGNMAAVSLAEANRIALRTAYERSPEEQGYSQEM